MTHIVWFKRDLRIHDHAPLVRACEAAVRAKQTVLCLYVFEPSIVGASDYAHQHYEFARESLIELRRALREIGGELVVQFGETVDVLDAVAAQSPITHIWSHEETGNALTFARDLAVGAWSKAHGVKFTELPQFGVVRRLRDRNGWAKRWETLMAENMLPAPKNVPTPQIVLPTNKRFFTFLEPDKSNRQRGGRSHALDALHSFLTERGRTYQRGMSSPVTAPHVCSRLSPYLALGCISMREVVHALRAAQPSSAFAASLRSFDGRLHWHCHFIQKLESEPGIEFHAFVPALDGIRPPDEHTLALLHAWQAGRTGYPMVDACMRMLCATGWLNFRMRAMLVSFAAYNLWLDWRLFAHFLARQFLDYEPGIHYSQLQMQSGVTGINTLRMYNPTKQGQEHDAQGTFIKIWCPELANVPTPQLYEPWKLTEDEQTQYGVKIGVDYPEPIVDWKQSYAHARAAFSALKKQDDVQTQADGVQEKHGSRKSGMKPTGHGRRKKKVEAVSTQSSLF
jgi:deoxyribodipyrimidine photo-lyase